jgi:hypothetical protein
MQTEPETAQPINPCQSSLSWGLREERTQSKENRKKKVWWSRDPHGSYVNASHTLDLDRYLRRHLVCISQPRPAKVMVSYDIHMYTYQVVSCVDVLVCTRGRDQKGSEKGGEIL